MGRYWGGGEILESWGGIEEEVLYKYGTLFISFGRGWNGMECLVGHVCVVGYAEREKEKYEDG